MVKNNLSGLRLLRTTRHEKTNKARHPQDWGGKNVRQEFWEAAQLLFIRNGKSSVFVNMEENPTGAVIRATEG